MNRIYFDHNATTNINDKVRNALHSLPNLPYNASANHSYGREARKIVEDARTKIFHSVGLINNSEWQIVFVSSGTEANNLLINSFVDYTIIISSIEHSSVENPAYEAKNYFKISVNDQGLLDLVELEQTLKRTEGKKLLSFILANNETGVIQNIDLISKLARKYDCIIHSDAVQAFGKIPIDLNKLDCDLITISAHKCGGPIGAACLIFKKSVALIPMIKGGGQERGLRSGTENIQAIYGFGIIASIIEDNMIKYQNVEMLRNKLENKILTLSEEIKIASNKEKRLPNTSMIITPNVSNQSQLIAFDLANIAVSIGSACSSGKIKISKTLLAMGYSNLDAECAIRISLGINNNEEEIDYFYEEFKKIYNRAKNLN